MKNKHDILILQKQFVPIHIVSWQTGINLVYKGAAHALDREFVSYEYDDWVKASISNMDDYAKIKTASYQVAVPEIVALTHYDRLPDKEVKYSRENIFKAYKFRCAYCGQTFPLAKLTVDHVIPRSKGGKSVWTNAVPACKVCNNQKADKTPEQAGMPLLLKPVKPKWINPLNNVAWKDHPCKSWEHFMGRIGN